MTGHRQIPIPAPVVIPGAAAVVKDQGDTRGIRANRIGKGPIRAGLRHGQAGQRRPIGRDILVEAVVDVDQGGRSEVPAGRIVGHRHGLTGDRRIRAGRDHRAGLPSSATTPVGLAAEILHIDMLDVRLADVALCVGGLDIVIEQLVAEIGQVGVGDFDKVVIRLLIAGQEVVDLAWVGGRRIQGLTRLGQYPLVHVERDPRPDLSAACICLILVAGQRVVAVSINPDFQLHAAVRDAAQVVSMGPNVKFRIHPLEKGIVGNLRLLVEPTESESTRIVGEALGLEDGRRRPIVVTAGRGHPGLQLFDGPAGGQARLDLVVVAQTTVIVKP